MSKWCSGVVFMQSLTCACEPGLLSFHRLSCLLCLCGSLQNGIQVLCWPSWVSHGIPGLNSLVWEYDCWTFFSVYFVGVQLPDMSLCISHKAELVVVLSLPVKALGCMRSRYLFQFCAVLHVGRVSFHVCLNEVWGRQAESILRWHFELLSLPSSNNTLGSLAPLLSCTMHTYCRGVWVIKLWSLKAILTYGEAKQYLEPQKGQPWKGRATIGQLWRLEHQQDSLLLKKMVS